MPKNEKPIQVLHPEVLENALRDGSPDLQDVQWSDFGNPVNVYLGVKSRFAIQFQRGESPSNMDLARMEILASKGLSDADIDSRAFAHHLVDAIADRLSIYDLECIISAFRRELQEQEQKRKERLSSRAAPTSD